MKQYSGQKPVLIEQLKTKMEKEIIFMRRTEIISETTAAETKAGKGRLSKAKKVLDGELRET